MAIINIELDRDKTIDDETKEIVKEAFQRYNNGGKDAVKEYFMNLLAKAVN